jgi:hypothetical protein
MNDDFQAETPSLAVALRAAYLHPSQVSEIDRMLDLDNDRARAEREVDSWFTQKEC